MLSIIIKMKWMLNTLIKDINLKSTNNIICSILINSEK